MKKKSEVPTIMVKLIKHLKKTMDYTTTTLRCDNAGENLMTEVACMEAGLGIEMEYTAVNTPQQNGRVERKFQTLYGRVRAMLNGARLTKKLRGICGLNVQELLPIKTIWIVIMRVERLSIFDFGRRMQRGLTI